MNPTVRVVLFFKVGSSPIDGSGGTCYFASEDVQLPLGEKVKQMLGGEIDGAKARESGNDRVAVVSSAASMVEVWERPAGFQAGKLGGQLINNCRYTRLKTITEVVAIREAQ